MVSENEDSGIIAKTLELAGRALDLVWDNNSNQDIWHWVILIFILIISLLVAIIFLLKTLGGVFESSAKLVENYKSSGLPLWLNKGNKVTVRKRKQFCAVLEADLAYLAKAENWNDQYFTDLEAEVETEGGYYATALHKLRGKKSFGLRKVHSLIRAITTSSERAMQLVGEPGSGKSVALRHLAKQLAEQGRKSNDKNAIVPLYVNLREMELPTKDNVNADSVREFILDNIRRGDADTSAFVRENWQDYCSRGIWLFLFDSFDEIPAVLHAEAGSNIIKKYSQALRQFLEGMGECKGILASREFKGPEALPWEKLRILPLTGEKQDELICNSFLDERNMGMVRQHLANSHSSIGSTPLFLTLLCRYVRDEQRPPNNDHDILYQHIDRLARREPDYFKRKYKLNPTELVLGAERLARLFAEDDSLSLAPSLDQIRSQLSMEEVPGGSLDNLIFALVDSKIGRSDVPNAAPGDRRFAFSHRRYQEALFVRYLTNHPEVISPKALLTEPRWREYTVTLLQTRGYEEFSDLLSHAILILNECSSKNNHIICGQHPLPSNLVYYNWENEIASSLLSLLQEGLAHRLQDVPYSLTNSVSNFLKPRWENGDAFDRNEVLRLGGLLPHDTLVKYLVETFRNGTKSERLHAFRQAAFTQELPEEARDVVLKMLSEHIISAKDRADLLTIEALAARLPQNMGANVVVTRAKLLRRNFGIIKKIVPKFILVDYAAVFLFMFSSLRSSAIYVPKVLLKEMKGNYQNIILENDLTFLFSMVLSSWLLLIGYSIKYQSKVVFFLLSIDSIILASLLFMFSPFLVRHLGKKVGIKDVMYWLISCLKIRKLIKGTFFMLMAIAIIFIVSISTGRLVFFLANKYFHVYLDREGGVTVPLYFLAGFVITMFIIYVLIIIKVSVDTKKTRRLNRLSLNILAERKLKGEPNISLLYSAEDYEQLVFWLKSDDELMADVHSIRVFSSFTLNFLRMQKVSSGENEMEFRPSCLISKVSNQITKKNAQDHDLKMLRQILEDGLLKLR